MGLKVLFVGRKGRFADQMMRFLGRFAWIEPTHVHNPAEVRSLLEERGQDLIILDWAGDARAFASPKKVLSMVRGEMNTLRIAANIVWVVVDGPMRYHYADAVLADRIFSKVDYLFPRLLELCLDRLHQTRARSRHMWEQVRAAMREGPSGSYVVDASADFPPGFEPFDIEQPE